jgi:uncharacterized protein (TIGR00303 family)
MPINDITVAGNRGTANSFVESVRGEDCQFVCVISYTRTCEIPGITAAGANADLLQYTPAADVEFLYHGECKCIKVVPATPDGKPTPALITRAAISAAKIPLTIVDAGVKIKPDVPHISFEVASGENISHGSALPIYQVRKAFDNGVELGVGLGRKSKHVVIGESIPGGTTTAMGVLLGMGIDARYKVSSSMADNPHALKLAALESGFKSASISMGSLPDRPFEAVSHFGDAMIPSVAGIAIGAARNAYVTLAGGTQMAAVLSVINSIERKALQNIVVGTTSYVLNDRSSDIRSLVSSICDIPILACDLRLEKSRKDGLKAYAIGFVKEGVGAGGACIAAILKTDGAIDGERLLSEIEREYERAIER